jgi:plasmid stabilization system protein ParE
MDSQRRRARRDVGKPVALRWSPPAFEDIRRLHAFLFPIDPRAAERSVKLIVGRIERIPQHPRLGERMPGFDDREIRRVLVEQYEIRYEVRGADIVILRLFHTREDR